MDVSAHRFESRGMLHCEIDIPEWTGKTPLHMRPPGTVQAGASPAIAGTGTAYRAIGAARRRPWLLQEILTIGVKWRAGFWWSGLTCSEAFELTEGRAARSFPSALPLFRLDRIYVRGFQVEEGTGASGPALVENFRSCRAVSQDDSFMTRAACPWRKSLPLLPC